MKICPGFWDFIDKKNSETVVYSVRNIYDELFRGGDKDELVSWVKERKDVGLFLEVDDNDTQLEYQKIVQYVNDHPIFSPQEKIRFLSEADPWLIAKAKTFGAKVVTNEVLVGLNSTKVKIPNICNEFEVEYISLFDFLRELKAEFILSS